MYYSWEEKSSLILKVPCNPTKVSKVLDEDTCHSFAFKDFELFSLFQPLLHLSPLAYFIFSPKAESHFRLFLYSTVKSLRTGLCCVLSHSVVFDSSQPHRLLPTRLLRLRNFPLPYWSGLPFPPPRDHPDPGSKPMSPALAGRFFTIEPPGKPQRHDESDSFPHHLQS